MPYDRDKSVTYAHDWAYDRNPQYYNFDRLGGDCTSFVSQCMYAGCGVMNYKRDVGWYYISLNNRAAAWTGVEYLYRFLTTNKERGPYAQDLPMSYALPGDIIQLSFDGLTYSHSMLIVEAGSPGDILVAAHSYDTDNRPLGSYSYQLSRLLHVDGVRG